MTNASNHKVDRTVTSHAFLRMAASSLIVATTLAGCSGNATQSRIASTANPDRKAGELAASAERALAKQDAVAAVQAAEAVVAMTPREAGYRVLLGRAYLAAGRFASAKTALSDAMTLGAVDAKTIVSLALAKVASGEPAGARDLLAEHMDVIPASDYGLAMAMAGDPLEGVRILSHAIQEPGAGAKARQNLAYAYALAGRWRDARMMAEADLAPVAAAQRVAMWAQTAEAGAEPYRVAALIGAKAGIADPGLPQQLALVDQSLVQIAVAQTQAPATAPEIAQETASEAAPDAEPEAAPRAVAMARAEPAAAAVEAPLIAADPTPAREAAPIGRAQIGRAYARAMRLTAHIQTVAYIRPITNSASNWVVQVGAYDSAAIAREKWQMMARSSFSGFQPVNSTVTVDGRLYHRLALSGFAGRADADQMCAKIRSRGGNCFVRQTGPEAKVQNWAAAKFKSTKFMGRQIAMR
ncbi:SPOR domain-containing protein [Sphingobium aquiterrae]|uniref:SPOR domain-containing protein n=1 Tax=Sphingobium aquiterrae TaxID=2038656 RepID=UPI00301A1813